MIDIEPPVNPHGFRRFPGDIDSLLRAYMQSEMRDPWPAVPALPPPPVAPSRARRWLHPSSRFALAASLAAFLVGSLALTSLFPTQLPQSKEQGNSIGEIELGQGVRELFNDTTPKGDKVKGWEMQKGNTTIIKIEMDPMP
jgi:hypothetical protein